mmetsp:Transcript_37676/g.87765  ORF Transcript_37676/g.87765 Transcript_37676/m.87765 type:complete len:80 (+) Transcript_37676:121-360(+)
MPLEVMWAERMEYQRDWKTSPHTGHNSIDTVTLTPKLHRQKNQRVSYWYNSNFCAFYKAFESGSCMLNHPYIVLAERLG